VRTVNLFRSAAIRAIAKRNSTHKAPPRMKRHAQNDDTATAPQGTILCDAGGLQMGEGSRRGFYPRIDGKSVPLRTKGYDRRDRSGSLPHQGTSMPCRLKIASISLPVFELPFTLSPLTNL
jgi:hypothetical protein